MNTPGWGGYLLAWAASDAALALLYPFLDPGELTPGVYATVAFVVLLYGGVFSVAFAPPGLVLVHLLCRRVEAQWVHVLAAGGAGLLAGVVAEVWLLDGDSPAFVLVLAAATAAGRAAVIPLVPRRRQPVDDDFAGTSTRW